MQRTEYQSQAPELKIPESFSHLHSQYLKDALYPFISKGLLDLCNKFINEEQVVRYMEKTHEQRVVDEEEKSQIESRLLKLQLGMFLL